MRHVAGGHVTGRGCSTNNKLFFTECENHVMLGEGQGLTTGGERICYCGTFLCNAADTLNVSPVLIPISYLLVLNL